MFSDRVRIGKKKKYKEGINIKSIKAGHGPSVMKEGSPVLFPLFGIVFFGMGVVSAAYHYKNATSKDRYSIIDITDNEEESNPLTERFGCEEAKFQNTRSTTYPRKNRYCPYCGDAVESGFIYCNSCGKKLPE